MSAPIVDVVRMGLAPVPYRPSTTLATLMFNPQPTSNDSPALNRISVLGVSLAMAAAAVCSGAPIVPALASLPAAEST
jgi:hypothetical protein